MNMEFRMNLRVSDEQTLFAAARIHAIDVDHFTPEQADDLLKTSEGEVNTGACLIMLLDPGSLPGCSIEQSTAD